jgi:CubicO group peptidase (beta-lactamase class C family)
MKIKCVVLMILMLSNVVFSQSEKCQNSFDQFIKNYNSNLYDCIFDHFSIGMQQALPFEKSQQFFSGLQVQAGTIKTYDLQKTENDNTAIYKTTFERGIFSIQISVDTENKISGFLVQLFIEPSNSILVNRLNGYPKEIASIIYTNSKDFPPNTQVSVAIITNGKAKYYGAKVVNDTLIAIENNNKVFEIGSLSKVFTSTILAALVVDGKINLKDQINPVYTFLFKNNASITYESIANHTSGLPRLPINLDVSNTENPYKNYGVKEFDYFLSNQMQLASATNNEYDYSNTGAGLLGHTLALSQNTTFKDLLENLIFKKYKMNASYTNAQNIGNRLVRGLDAKGDEISNWDFDVLVGAGGILSTTTDLVQFAQAQFEPKNKALELTRNPTATINDNMKIGLGWHILKSKKGGNLIWHNGGTGGYSTSMALDV